MSEEEQKAIEILSLKAITSSAEAPEYPNTIVMKKDLITVLNLISKLQSDIEIKDKVIDNLYADIEYEYQGTNYLKSLEEYYEEVEKVGGEDE